MNNRSFDYVFIDTAARPSLEELEALANGIELGVASFTPSGRCNRIRILLAKCFLTPEMLAKSLLR